MTYKEIKQLVYVGQHGKVRDAFIRAIKRRDEEEILTYTLDKE